MCNGIEKIKCTQLPHKFSYIVAILGHNHFESPNSTIYCDQKILDTNVIVLSYILKRPLCINNLNFDCVNFENVNVRFTEKIFKKL
jgi:hypothetical protein